MNETTTMEMVHQRVEDDPDYKSAAAQLAALHAQREGQLKHREDLRLILAHTRDQHVPVPPALALMDVRDARREAAAVDRAIEDLESAIETQRRRVDQARNEAAEKIFNAHLPQLNKLAAGVEEVQQNLALARAPLVALVRDLERRGVSTGRLAPFMIALR